MRASIAVLDALCRIGRIRLEHIWMLPGELDEGVRGQKYPDLPQTLDDLIRIMCKHLW